tara:strand:+ start:98 stop:1456 length:1359 start_codon:yes stop_codon:yes gene_type:complete
MKKIFLFFVFCPIVSFAQIEFIGDLDPSSKSSSDFFRGITTIKIRVPSDYQTKVSLNKSMDVESVRGYNSVSTSFSSNLANALAHSFEKMNFKIEKIESSFDPNNCETIYLDLSDINLSYFYDEKRTLESPINLPIYNCSGEFELIGEFKLKKKKKDFWSKRLFYNQVLSMLEKSNIFSFEESKNFGFRALLDRKDLKTEKVLHLDNKKIALDNHREAEKMFKEYWARNFFSGDPIEGIYEQTGYYKHRKYNYVARTGDLYSQRFKIIITLDDSKDFYNIFYLYNTSSKDNFNIGDPLGRIYKTDILNNFDLERSFDSSDKFNPKKEYNSIKVAFGGYKTIDDYGYEISNDDYYYRKKKGSTTSYSNRPSLSSRNIESYLKNSNGFFVFYNSDENDWEFDAYFQRLFSPQKIAMPPTLKNKKTVTKRRSSTTKKSKKTAVKKAPPPAAKRKD